MKKLFLFLYLLILPPFAIGEVVERVVAIVNDDLVTELEIERLTNKLKSGGMVDDLLIADPKELLKDRKKMISILVDEKLLDSEVRRQSLEVTVEKVEQEIQSILQRNRIDKNQLKASLKEQGVSFSEYQDFIKKRLERQSLVEKAITSKIKISDEEVASHYMGMKGPAGADVYEYNISHILFLPKNGDVNGAKVRAEATVEKIKSGTNFDTAVTQFTEDPNFSNGGLLGVFKSGEFLKELEDAVRPLSVGATSSVVRTRIGFHILKLNSKKLVANPDFEKNKETYRNQLYQIAFKKQFTFWLDQKRQEAFIRIN